MQLDEFLKVVGEFGKFQKIRVFLLCLFGVVCGCQYLSMVFIGATPDFHCKIPEVNFSTSLGINLTDEEKKALLIPEGDPCHHYDSVETADLWRAVNFNLSFISLNKTRKRVTCSNGYEYSRRQYTETVTSEFDLVCDRRFLMTSLKTVYILGQFCGALVIGQLSDRFGRRFMFVVVEAVLLVAGCVAALAPNIYVFLPMYLFQGASLLAVYTVGYILATELVGTKYRGFVHFAVSLSTSIGNVGLSGVAFYIREWRYLQITTTAPILLFSTYYFFLPESVPWLLSQGKDVQAEAIIQKVATTNGVILDKDTVSSLKESTTNKTPRVYYILDCVRTWRMAKLSIIIWFIWAVNAMVYYGLTLSLGNLTGSPYMNFFIAAAVEIPAKVICLFLLDCVGRRMPLIMFMYISGLSSLLSGIIPTNDDSGLETLVVVLVMIGKFGITASFSTLYLMTAEIFPTVIRNVGFGVGSTIARCGSIMSPILVDLSTMWGPLPFVVFGVLSIVAGTLAILLPETMGKPLPQLPEDIKDEKLCPRLLCCTEKQVPENHELKSLDIDVDTQES